MDTPIANNLQDRIPSTLSQTAVMGVLEHEVGRQRILAIVKEHESTRDFETAVQSVVERYIKIRQAERTNWIVGLVATGILSAIIGHFVH